jgi:hypothetical protein
MHAPHLEEIGGNPCDSPVAKENHGNSFAAGSFAYQGNLVGAHETHLRFPG